METLHIYVFGEIAPDSDPLLSEQGIVGSRYIASQLAKNPSATKVVAHINSPGGDVDEGFAMYDILVNSGKDIETIIEGRCSSIATIVFLAGRTRKITENSKFFIHNPWTGTEGDADALRLVADALQKTENTIINFYHQKTGLDKILLDSKMKEQTDFTADEAVALGFATEKVPTVSAKAYLKNQKSMSKPISLKQRLNNAIKALQNVKDLDLTLSDGTGIVVETDNPDVSKGDGVSIDGNPAADGEYTLSDGRVIVVASGVVADIKPVPANNTATNNNLNDALVKALEDIVKNQKALQDEFKALKTAQGDTKKDTEMLTEAVELIGQNLHSQGFKGMKKKQTFSNKEEAELTPESQKAKAIEAARKKAGLKKDEE